MIVYLHSECQLGVGGYRMKYDVGKPPNTTIPEDMVDAAKDTRRQCSILHISEEDYECKSFKDYPNLYI